MKSALITGITGQDGSYLAELLLEKGYEVHGLIRRLSTSNHWRIDPIKPKINLIYGDILDEVSLMRAVEISQPDECYHLAAQSQVGISFTQPIFTAECTGIGTLKILEAIKAVKPDTKFYNAASSELFGKVQEVPQTELTPFYPRSPYGVAKLYGYWITKNYREAYDMFACSGILFNHECLSENSPVLIKYKKTNTISIKRIRDIRRARRDEHKSQWTTSDLEIWDGNDFADLLCITATKPPSRFPDVNMNCRIINTRHGVVETTNHHNMIKATGDSVAASTLSIDDKLLHGEFPETNGFDNISKLEAKFLGLMVGDGSISADGRAKFSNNNDHISKIFNDLWNKIGLGYTTSSTSNKGYGVSRSYALSGNGSYLRSLRQELYTYDGYKKIPDRILNSSKEIMYEFLVGYNMADGLKKNPCKYLFKNFKTNSIVLAQGLLFLIKNTTNQDYNITFEEDKKYYGYYSINFLSDHIKKNIEKEKLVKELLLNNGTVRGIHRSTGISRAFIKKIRDGGMARRTHHRYLPRDKVKKIITHRDQPEFVCDIETSSGRLMAGLGSIVVSNSPRRSPQFVTRKITKAAARIKLGLQKELRLGNLDAKRDWSHASDMVRGMHLMLQQDKPDDFVLSSGETHSVREFCKLAFDIVGLNYEDYVVVDPEFYRPADVDLLVGSAWRARTELGWEPEIDLRGLVGCMMYNDVRIEKSQINQV